MVSDVEQWCPDALWQLAEPLIPQAPARAQGGGRRRVDNRPVLAAIMYVVRTGCSWWALPSSFGVSRPTAHRRFTEWAAAGFFASLHRAMLDVLGAAGEIDWSRCCVDSMSVRAVKGGI